MTRVKSLKLPEDGGYGHRVHRKQRFRVHGKNGNKANRRYKIRLWEMKHGAKWKSTDRHESF